MRKTDNTLYKTPFSVAYWRTALADFKTARNLTFAALMIAACVALSYVPSIHIGDGGVRVTWGFLARALCGAVCGPVTALVFGFAEDTVSYLIHPTGAYFPGYALTTMLGTLIYALFLYRAKLTPVTLAVRVALAKFFTNVLNVFLGALWSTILMGKGYWVRVTASAAKNAVMFPVQAVMLFFLLAALLPILGKMGMVPKGELASKPRQPGDPWEK